MHGLTATSRPGRHSRPRVAILAAALALPLTVSGLAWSQQGRSPVRPGRPPALTSASSGPGGMAVVPPTEDPRAEPPAVAPLDEAVRPASAGDEGDPLGPARERTGSGPPAAAAPGGSAGEGDGFAVPTDRLSRGKQELRLSIEVQPASAVINLNRETTVNLVVRNLGNVEALGVSAVCRMPDGLELVSSVPPASQDPANKANYYWPKPSLAAGGEWVIPLKVKASKVGALELGETVTAKAGARATLVVQEPRLKVEQVAEPSRLLKGKQATFRISVSNPGTGPARNVLIQAKLSDGLRTLDGDSTVEQTIANLPASGGTVHLDPLIVNTRAGGVQTCEVVVSSPDVTTSPPEDTRSIKQVEVISPKLAMNLTGPESRWTDQKGDYALVVQNTGTAPAENVKLVVTMPTAGGRMTHLSGESGQFDKDTRKLFWNIGRIEPKDEKKFGFTYLTTGPGLYTTLAEATSGEDRVTKRLSTEVKGLAVVVVRMSSSNHVIDVGESTVYDIEIRNVGTQDATKVQLNGTLSTNMTIPDQGITGLDKAANYNNKDGRILFPEIERIPPGKSVTVSIEARAKSRGSGMCRIQLAHADLPRSSPKPSDDDLIHAVAQTTITGDSPARSDSSP